TELDMVGAGRRSCSWSGRPPCSETPGGRVAGQWGSVGADAAQVAQPPLRLPRPRRFVQGVDRGGCNEMNPLPPARAPRLISSKFLRPGERLPFDFVSSAHEFVE